MWSFFFLDLAFMTVCVCVCMCVTHNGTGLCDEEEFSEGSVKRQQHCDTGGILAQAVFHWHKELPQRSQQSQLTGSKAQTNRWLEEQTRTQAEQDNGWLHSEESETVAEKKTRATSVSPCLYHDTIAHFVTANSQTWSKNWLFKPMCGKTIHCD